MPTLTDEDEIRDLLTKTRRFNRSSYEYYENHFEELQNTHGGEVVAIVDTQIVDSIEQTTDMLVIEDFVERVRDEHGDEAFITHIPEPDQTLIL